MGDLSFVPNDDTMDKIMETVKHNHKCPLDERITLGDDVRYLHSGFLF